MPGDNRFKQSVIVTLAKRAANRCSNPDCAAITSGPADDPSRSVNVGEAAHIYGASDGSARYDPTMESADRGSITNAIWLCGNCHKMVDDDPSRYPAGLLFEWQRDHERRIAEQVGKAGADLRRRFEDRHLEEFGALSYLAERIILEKGDLWEYRLTTEVLRYEMRPVLQRWDGLKRGLYMKPNHRVSKMEAATWMQTRLSEVVQIARALSELMNVEFARAWGEPGVPGVDTLIVSTCRLFSGVCSSAIDWEEAVRFAYVDKAFEEVRDLFIGVAGGLIEEAAKVPEYLGGVFAGDPEPGVYRLILTIELPDGWNKALEAALARATNAF
ncbi:MAG TPA: hypothetical protein VGO55_13970 [Allosphingosinicella sp.]|jgi:hypothetical protein|nr:hypothetical protein [Allosphingosinicella sp.]